MLKPCELLVEIAESSDSRTGARGQEILLRKITAQIAAECWNEINFYRNSCPNPQIFDRLQTVKLNGHANTRALRTLDKGSCKEY